MKKENTLTHKQKQVFDFIREKIKKNLPPTIREIAQFMGFKSTGTVRDYLDALESKGYIKRQGSLSRSIELLKGVLTRIPIIGSIPAGNPDLAYEDIQGYVDFNDVLPQRVSPDEVFALKVKGESMIDAGIMDGDLAVIRRQAVAVNGEVIAALLDDNEVTLKRLRYKNDLTYLEPANKNFQPIHKDFTILGKVITVLRKYN